LFKLLFLLDFLRALCASAVQTPIPASHKSLKNLREKSGQLRTIANRKWRTVILIYSN
jgi:hypothetical protein